MDKLKKIADNLRIDSLKSTTIAGSGHPTSCLSCAEIMSCLFFKEIRENDEFILSKGHAAPILWASYAEAGLIPKKELNNLRKITSNLEGHPTPNMPLVKVATGSLGQGLSAGIGMALGKKIKQEKGRVYVLLGDGECAEGSIWEAASIASYYSLENLCAIIDVNKYGQTQQTMYAYHLEKYEKIFKAFGWNTILINGHKIKEILNAFKQAKKSKKPTAIIAKTTKGKGVSFLENKKTMHGKPLNKKELKKALKEIKYTNIKITSKIKKNKKNKETYKFTNYTTNKYKKGELISTREAFGKGLVRLGEKNKQAIVLDGDVKNSTKTEYFFEKFPENSIECFIAEQNMTGIAIGLSAQGFTPYVATFAAFLTRAHDFIRMAVYSKANIKFIGSHAGISIGQDGPSQMGLEDIAMFLSIPDSIILYPCDAVSTEKLLREMAKHKGISYLRTTRNKTPVLYDNKEKFRIGGLKVLRKSSKDKALVISAGITVHEALKAYDILKKEKINIRVVDLYSVQPTDAKGLLKNAKECKNNVIVAEDHYFDGIGSVVMKAIGKIKHLYVKKIPRSGKPEKLMKKYSIDYNAIIRTVKSTIKSPQKAL